MNYPFTPEQLGLMSLARISWKRRGSAKRNRVFFSEESVTETIILDLIENYPGYASVVPFHKNQEGETGADWAWAFENVNGTAVLPMLVQAKALDFSDHEYPEIKRKIGTSTTRQIDRLIQVSELYGWPPVYTFYNHLDDISRVPETCQSIFLAGTSQVPESWGVSFADAYQVRAVLNDQTFDTHRLHSRPLHCLLCSGGTGRRPAEGSPGLAGRTLRELRDILLEEGDIPSETPPALSEPLRELPDLFAKAREITLVDDPHEQDRARRALAEQHPNLRGVVILKDSARRSDLRD